MGPNISDEAHRLAQELAALTGETLTATITQAVREQLHRVREERDGDFVERILAIGRKCAAHLEKSPHALEIEDLYGDDGLPR
jgi:antitoxin VapB